MKTLFREKVSLRMRKNYIILQEYIKYVFLLLTKVMNPTMNLISGTHNFYEMREYTFNVLSEYSIIILK